MRTQATVALRHSEVAGALRNGVADLTIAVGADSFVQIDATQQLERVHIQEGALYIRSTARPLDVQVSGTATVVVPHPTHEVRVEARGGSTVVATGRLAQVWAYDRAVVSVSDGATAYAHGRSLVRYLDASGAVRSHATALVAGHSDVGVQDEGAAYVYEGARACQDNGRVVTMGHVNARRPAD